MSKLASNDTNTCDICDTENVKLVQSCRLCSHENKYCQTCIIAHISEAINGKGSVTNVECPYADCRCIMPSEELLAHIGWKADLCRKADHILFMGFLRSSPNFRWCANPRGCGSGAELEGDTRRVSFFTCQECFSMTCVEHKVPWYP